jgi:hypothetical protein
MLAVGLFAGGVLAADVPSQTAGYFNNFDNVPLGRPQEDLRVLDGDFIVKAEGSNHFLELSPEPLKNFGALFGPEGVAFADVGAKIFATSTGRRFPEFGIGCGDGGGYKLMLVPGQALIELRRGDEPVSQAAYDKWQSGQWFSFRIKVIPAADSKWRIQGKVWPASAKEPEAWSISSETADAPDAGRASIWAMPYSGTPVRFDDLSAAGAGPTK